MPVQEYCYLGSCFDLKLGFSVQHTAIDEIQNKEHACVLFRGKITGAVCASLWRDIEWTVKAIHIDGSHKGWTRLDVAGPQLQRPRADACGGIRHEHGSI